jgi:hypothetical protein
MTLEKYAPSNNEMKRTKPAMITVARSSPLISVLDRRHQLNVVR